MSFLSRSTLLIAAAAAGFAAAAHSQAKTSAAATPDSRVDIYAGIAYFSPVNSAINGYLYQPVSNANVTASVTGYFNRFLGVQAEGAYFSGSGEHINYFEQNSLTCHGESCDQLVYTAEGGPVLRLPLGPFVPFVHVLGGGARENGPVAQPLRWGWGITGGGGLDYVMPYFNQRFALRLLQADFFYSDINYGALVPPLGISGGEGKVDAYKISAGLVARFGGSVSKPATLQLGCSVVPVSAFPGDPLQISGNAIGTDSKHQPVYTWTTNGGKITGSGVNPGIDTTGLAPGEYVVKGHLAEGKKAGQQADCDAPFTVRGYDPPTIACTATPNVATSGAEIAISTSGGSPQNRPLTYSYAATEGEITSSGPTAKLATAGLSPALITITCNVVDDLGKSAQATTTVTLSAPPVPVVPATQPLCTLTFDRDKRRPVRVDNEASACLDDVAITLNQQSGARLIIVGNYESPELNIAGAQRAMNARLYLTQQKGIDPSRIELRVGEAGSKTATDTLVPPGAIFNEVGTHLFNDKNVTLKGPPYGRGTAHPRAANKPGSAPVVSPGQAPASTAPTTP